MSAILSLKNLPAGLYDALKAQAQNHRRSLNSEAIYCLERALGRSQAFDETDTVTRARQLRMQLSAEFSNGFAHEEVSALKNQGR